MEVQVRRLDPETVADFFQLHGGAPFGWCFCAAWSVPTWEGWGERTAAANRAAREELLARARHDGFLAYRDGTPVGWCQAGPLHWWPKLLDQYTLDPEPEAAGIVCLAVHPAHRRRGVATALGRAALAAFLGEGVRVVYAFPRQGSDLEAWTGPPPLWTALGFTPFRPDPRRPIVRRVLAP